jgi:hypothetical protein
VKKFAGLQVLFDRVYNGKNIIHNETIKAESLPLKPAAMNQMMICRFERMFFGFDILELFPCLVGNISHIDSFEMTIFEMLSVIGFKWKWTFSM